MPNTFSGGWGAVPLPIMCEVVIVDEGSEPAIGLSAMQMDNLQVGNGVGVQHGPGRGGVGKGGLVQGKCDLDPYCRGREGAQRLGPV